MNFSVKNVLCFYTIYCLLQNTRQEFCDQTETLNKLKTGLTNNSVITGGCKDQILDYINGIEVKEEWALNMLYSGAVPVPSMNTFGFFDKCVNVYDSGSGKLNITGQYCLVSVLPSKSTYNTFSEALTVKSGVQVATCVPNKCQAKDTQNFYSLLGLNVSVDQSLCQTKSPNLQMTTVVIVATTIFSIIFVTILSATIYYMCCDAKGTFFGNLSLQTNFHRLVSKGNANQLQCLHGIRAICIVGVIFTHVEHNQGYLPIQNSWYMNTTWSKSIFGAVLLNTGNTVVQTFFLLSGFLIGYTYMKLLQRNGQLNILKYYLNRYFRLTPAIAAVVLFYVSYFDYLGSGPFWPSLVTQTQVGACYKQWWMALLYIQNFSPSTDYCISQSWYLSVDMQLYILSPILLYIIENRPQCFLTVCKGILLGSFLYTIFIVLYFKPSISPNSHNPEEMKNSAITYSLYNDSVIINATPWITGMGLSYLVIINQEKNVIISKIWVTILWTFSASTIIVGTTINSIVISSSSNHDVLQDLYLILYRICWAITIAWVIFACIFNYAGCINNFLSLPIFQVFSKLSYSMYLVHNAIIFTIIGQYRYPIVFGSFETLEMMCATIVFTIFFASLLILFIELPGMVISEYFFKRKTSKKSILLVSRSYTENNAS